jgi:hypothetical protein
VREHVELRADLSDLADDDLLVRAAAVALGFMNMTFWCTSKRRVPKKGMV